MTWGQPSNLPNSDTFSFRLLEGLCVKATDREFTLAGGFSPPLRDKNKRFACQNVVRIARVVPDCRITNDCAYLARLLR